MKKKKDKELLFVGVDLPKAVKEFITERKDELAPDLTEEEDKQFNKAVDMVLSIIDSLTLKGFNGEDFYVLTNQENNTFEEYFYEDLVKLRQKELEEERDTNEKN